MTHFRGLVLDLLELSRVGSERAELRLVDVDPRQYVAATVEQIAGPDIPVTVDSEVPATMRLDKRRIERVLANLLDNAQRHGGGATAVQISFCGDALQIAVEDAGPGVPEAERDLIFDRFHRGSRQQDASLGSGLGLAIVAEHCRAHGGAAHVEDRPRGGGRFVALFRDAGGT